MQTFCHHLEKIITTTSYPCRLLNVLFLEQQKPSLNQHSNSHISPLCICQVYLDGGLLILNIDLVYLHNRHVIIVYPPRYHAFILPCKYLCNLTAILFTISQSW